MEWSSWSGLGSGVSSTVYRVVVDGSGNVYAGWNLPHARRGNRGTHCSWNGSTWSGLGSGMNSSVYGLVLDGYGNLTPVKHLLWGGVIVLYIALWNGSAWSGLGSGMNASVTKAWNSIRLELRRGRIPYNGRPVSAGSIAKCAIVFPFPVLSSPSSGATVEYPLQSSHGIAYPGAVSYAIQVSSTSS